MKLIKCAVIGGVFFLVACEDKAKLAKIETQKSKIEELEAEEAVLRAELKGDPAGDPAADLAAAQKELEEINQEIVALEKDRDEAKGKFESSEKEFAEYRRKYHIPGGSGE